MAFLFVLLLLPWLWFLRGRAFFLPLFLAAMTGVGVLRAGQALERPGHHLVHFADDRWMSLEGRVISLPEVKEKGRRRIVSFVLEAANLFSERHYFETTGKAQVFLFNPAEPVPYGARIRLRGKLKRPRTPRNPGEFDYGHYLAGQGIDVIFEGYGARSHRVLEEGSGFLTGPLKAIQTVRDRLSRRLERLFPYPFNQLLKALLLGIRKGLPEEFRDDFMKTGTMHLLAISGMNVTLVAGSLFLLALFLGLPQKGSAVVGLVSTLAYVFLSGAGIPVVRAGWMTGLFFTGLLLEREKDLLNHLFFALFAVLIFDPLAFFQVGFQLSFLSVFSLILLRPRPLGEWMGEAGQTLVVAFGTFPLIVRYFNVFSWISLFANLLAIPLFHLGVLAGIASLFLGGIPYLGKIFIGVSTLFLKGGLGWIALSAKVPWGFFHLSTPSWGLVALYYAALSLFLFSRQKEFRGPDFLRPLSLTLWILTAVCFFSPFRGEKFSLTVLETPPSEILHIEFPGRGHWLVNAGRSSPSNQARWVVGPFLRQIGVKRLQGILLTDGSGRQSGGVSTLVRDFSVSTIFSTREMVSDPLLRRTNQRVLHAGDRLELGAGSGFWVPAIVQDQIFLVIYVKEKKFLFIPTVKSEILRKAIPLLEKAAPADVLILPSRGLQGPLREELLRRLVPTQVVAQKSGALEFTIQRGELRTLAFN